MTEQHNMVAFTNLGPFMFKGITQEQRDALETLAGRYGYDVAEVKLDG